MLFSLVLLALSVAEAPDLPVIEDNSGLFSPEEIEKATQQIHGIKKDFRGIDLYVETTKERPPATDREKKEWFWWRKKQLRTATLDDVAEQRAEALWEKRHSRGGNFDGVYVLIVDDGTGKREVGVAAYGTGGYGSDDKVSWVKRGALREVLLRRPSREHADSCLRELITKFRAQQRLIAEPPPSPLSVRGALLVVGGMVGVWLALLFVRWRAHRADPPGAPEPIALYQPAMMGTLFGVPAAFWVNDELFRSLPPEVPPPTDPAASFSLPPMPTLPPPGALTEGGAEPFTLPPESSHGEPPA